MKKRLTSVLLTICMVASLFSGLGVTAFADVETIEYTMKSGDNVYSICKKLGVDFYANYEWITNTNKIKNYSSIPVGKKLIFPVGIATDAPTATPAPGTNNTTTSKPGLALQSDDKIVSYLVPYVVSSGDTMYDICLREGINYNDSIDSIMKINGLKNASRIAVGRTLLLPTTKAPASGSCVAVVGHTVVKNDAAYNLCAGYNVDYNKNIDLLKALNGKTNMSSIKVGQTLLIPVPTTMVPGSTGGNTGNTGNTGSSGNAGNTDNSGNTGNTGNSGSTDNSTTTTSYKITKNTTNVDRGSYTVLVNNTNKTTAAKGDTVTVNASAKTGYKLDYVKVTDKNGNNVALNSTTFTMPASDVTIDVYFVSSTSYRITQSYPKNGSFTTVVNGSTTDDAAPGQTVEVVVAPEDGYQLNNIVVENSNKKSEVVSVVNKTFVMPNFDVTVKVDFLKADPAGNVITKEVIEGSGTFDVKINGSVVSAAKAGEVVCVDLKPSDGYILKKIEVRPNQAGYESDTISVNSDNQFVMPHYPVKVKVYYTADEFNIRSTSTENGSFIVYKSGDNTQTPVSKVTAGTQLVVNPTADKGYAVKAVQYTDKDGNAVEVKANGSGAYVFSMPTRDTTVSVEFRKGVYKIEALNGATFTVDGKTVSSAAQGSTVTVNPVAVAGHAVDKISVKCGNNDVTVTDGKFTMPIGKVTVNVEYKKVDLAISKAATSNGNFSFKLGDNNGKAITTAQVDQVVYVATSPANGYHTSKIVMTDAQGNQYDITGPQTFQMPGAAVTVTVSFAKN